MMSKVAGCEPLQNDVSPKTTRIGWIGTGIMGAPMAAHLLAAGYSVAVYNRSSDKANELLAAGALWCDSPACVAQQSDIVFSMVGYPRDVEEVVLGSNGLRTGWQAERNPKIVDTDHDRQRVFVDMTTSSPDLAESLARTLLQDNIVALDAPVSGGDRGAREASLSIMVGGDHDVFTRLMPLWQCLGKQIVWQGGPGAGQATKMVNQILIANTINGVCEAILYAQNCGLDLTRVFQSVAGGAAGSWQLTNLGPKIVDQDYEPGFMILHFVKDMTIALEESKKMGISLPGLEQVKQKYEQAIRAGYERLGTQALIRTMRSE
ncbi:MAG: NAD(P)-dependent oxidoreductase [Planctomycetia bacterium]|nr:NAD(P)-dependent oxidoreductase [Planctomycetia bacterium]